ncbi:MBOAT family protein, partial [Aliarcobacter butzleri]
TTYENIFGESKTTTFILLGLLVVLAFKNSMELRLTFFNLPKIFIYISIILMAYTLTNMTKFTEFLYFNF